MELKCKVCPKLSLGGAVDGCLCVLLRTVLSCLLIHCFAIVPRVFSPEAIMAIKLFLILILMSEVEERLDKTQRID